MADELGSMPCDNSACDADMSIRKDKRAQLYTVCACGRNLRNTPTGQKIILGLWETFQNGGAVDDDLNGVIYGTIPEDEPEQPLEIPEIIEEIPEKPKSGAGKKIMGLTLFASILGGAFWLVKKQTK